MIATRPAQFGFSEIKEQFFQVVDPNIRVYTLLDSTIPGFEFVFWNGIHIISSRDYVFDGNNITIDNQILLYAGDDIYVKYFI